MNVDLESKKNVRNSLEFRSCLGDELSSQLDQWLTAVDASHSPARAIIAPYPPFSHTHRRSHCKGRNAM